MVQNRTSVASTALSRNYSIPASVLGVREGEFYALDAKSLPVALGAVSFCAASLSTNLPITGCKEALVSAGLEI